MDAKALTEQGRTALVWAPVGKTVRQCNLTCTPLNAGMILDILDHKAGKLIKPEKMCCLIGSQSYIMRYVLHSTDSKAYVSKGK